ncbi:MAG: enoyl-CoA hydratase/isomerase family protein [Pigmentiphaga sp.]
MHSTPLHIQIGQAVATITLNNPDKRNPIGTATAQALVDALRELERDERVRVIVVTGAGGAFSAGGDLDEFLQTVDDGAVALWETGQPWYDLYQLLPALAKPVIARVDGPAMAGGCGIVASCDFAYASARSYFATPEIEIGLFTLFVLPGLLRCLSRRDALDLALTGRRIDAQEALRMRLVNSVCADTQILDQTVAQQAALLARIPPATMRRARHSFSKIEAVGFSEGLELARGLRPVFMASEELRHGIQKFKNK